MPDKRKGGPNPPTPPHPRPRPYGARRRPGFRSKPEEDSSDPESFDIARKPRPASQSWKGKGVGKSSKGAQEKSSQRKKDLELQRERHAREEKKLQEKMLLLRERQIETEQALLRQQQTLQQQITMQQANIDAMTRKAKEKKAKLKQKKLAKRAKVAAAVLAENSRSFFRRLTSYYIGGQKYQYEQLASDTEDSSSSDDDSSSVSSQQPGATTSASVPGPSGIQEQRQQQQQSQLSSLTPPPAYSSPSTLGGLTESTAWDPSSPDCPIQQYSAGLPRNKACPDPESETATTEDEQMPNDGGSPSPSTRLNPPRVSRVDLTEGDDDNTSYFSLTKVILKNGEEIVNKHTYEIDSRKLWLSYSEFCQNENYFAYNTGISNISFDAYCNGMFIKNFDLTSSQTAYDNKVLPSLVLGPYS